VILVFLVAVPVNYFQGQIVLQHFVVAANMALKEATAKAGVPIKIILGFLSITQS
jgi:hypothetical protein